jgi:hypothetical protein
MGLKLSVSHYRKNTNPEVFENTVVKGIFGHTGDKVMRN